MFETYQYTTWIKWNNVLVTWCIHGNEPCWANAINKIIEEIRNKKLFLVSWSVTFIPICNPQATKKSIRFLEENLARVFYKHNNPLSYEQRLATQLCKYVEEADAILDIHSGNAEKSKFVFQDYEEPEYQLLSNALWIDTIIHGWSKIYDASWEQDLSWFAHSLWIPSIVIECWQHLDPDATYIAYEAILRFLWLNGIIDHINESLPNTKHIMMQKLYKMEKQWKFIQERRNADPVSKWQTIVIYDDWEKVISDYNWYIVLPKTFANIGDEWFYIGTKV